MRILLVGASGYIGTRLARELSARGHTVIGCDLLEPVETGNFEKFFQDQYQNIPDSLLDNAQLLLWFAGHSSVGAALQAPVESLENNVTDLMKLFLRAAERRRPVVYASSASVLSSSEDVYSVIATESRSNVYDAGKLAFDLMAGYLGGQFLGLRMATVSGWSPKMRWDVVFNAMNRSASLDGTVQIMNPSNFRSLLFIEDLAEYINMMVEHHEHGSFPSGTAQVALGSWSGSIGSLGADIANYWKVEPSFMGDTGTYSFFVSDRELRKAFDDEANFYRSIGARCERFAQQNEWSHG